MNNKTAFIIVCWNGVEFVDKCLGSLVLQSDDEFEVIMVDNSSQDDSVQRAQQFQGQLNLHILRQPENLGFAEANNIGVDYIKKNLPQIEQVVIQNLDTYVPKNFVSQLHREINDLAPEVGLIVPKLLMWDEQTIHSTGVLLDKDLSAYNRGMYEQDEGQYDQNTDVFGAIGAGMVIKMEVLNKIEGNYMDREFFVYKEDDNLNWLIRLLGYQALFVPSLVIFHKAGGTTPAKSMFKLFHLERNRIWLLIKFSPWWYILPAVTLYTIQRIKKQANTLDSSKKQDVGSAADPSYSKTQALITLVKAYIGSLHPLKLTKMVRFRLQFKMQSNFIKIVKKYSAG